MASSMSNMIQLTKASTGIRGLDEVTHGGLPQGRCTLLSGGPGCGKIVLALLILVDANRDELLNKRSADSCPSTQIKGSVNHDEANDA